MSQVCPQCHNKLKNTQRVCRQCKRIMAFHKIADMTDQQWIDLVDELSAQGRYYFTLNQLFIHWQKPKVYRLYKSLTRLYISVFMLALFLFNQSLDTLHFLILVNFPKSSICIT